MRLYAHKAIEGMLGVLKLVDSSPEELARDIWGRSFHTPFEKRHGMLADLCGFARQAVVYDFSGVPLDDVHVEFGGMLLLNGMFDKYPLTAIISDDTDSFWLLEFFEEGPSLIVLCATPDEAVVPVVSYHKIQITWNEEVRKLVVTGHLVEHLKQPFLEQTVGADAELFVAQQFSNAIGFLATLGCKETEVVTVEAPPRLNASRAKRGREPIRDVKTIKINLKQTVASRGPLDGSRASPKPHWRRPHLRHLADGRVTPIPPMWVNWNGAAGTPAPDKKQYEVVP